MYIYTHTHLGEADYRLFQYFFVGKKKWRKNGKRKRNLGKRRQALPIFLLYVYIKGKKNGGGKWKKEKRSLGKRMAGAS